MDTVADALIRIKNGYMAYKDEVILPYSKLIISICNVLKKEKYIEDFKEAKHKDYKNITILSVTLRYENRKPALTGVERVSKPGLRVYKGKSGIPYVLNGLGIAIISTPKGVMTDKQARKAGLGGEVMAQVW
jgi:small subunit ribosomal protein S8